MVTKLDHSSFQPSSQSRVIMTDEKATPQEETTEEQQRVYVYVFRHGALTHSLTDSVSLIRYFHLQGYAPDEVVPAHVFKPVQAFPSTTQETEDALYSYQFCISQVHHRLRHRMDYKHDMMGFLKETASWVCLADEAYGVLEQHDGQAAKTMRRQVNQILYQDIDVRLPAQPVIGSDERNKFCRILHQFFESNERNTLYIFQNRTTDVFVAYDANEGLVRISQHTKSSPQDVLTRPAKLRHIITALKRRHMDKKGACHSSDPLAVLNAVCDAMPQSDKIHNWRDTAVLIDDDDEDDAGLPELDIVVD